MGGYGGRRAAHASARGPRHLQSSTGAGPRASTGEQTPTRASRVGTVSRGNLQLGPASTSAGKRRGHRGRGEGRKSRPRPACGPTRLVSRRARRGRRPNAYSAVTSVGDAGEGDGEGLASVTPPSGWAADDGHVDGMHASRWSSGRGQHGGPAPSERRATARTVSRRRRGRIQGEVERVRPLHVVAARVPRVQAMQPRLTTQQREEVLTIGLITAEPCRWRRSRPGRAGRGRGA